MSLHQLVSQNKSKDVKMEIETSSNKIDDLIK